MAIQLTCEGLFDTKFTDLLRATHRTNVLTKTELLMRFLDQGTLDKSQSTTKNFTHFRHALHVSGLVRTEPTVTA